MFCTFAEDADLLPGRMFTKMLEQARRRSAAFAAVASVLFGVTAVKHRLVRTEPVSCLHLQTISARPTSANSLFTLVSKDLTSRRQPGNDRP